MAESAAGMVGAYFGSRLTYLFSAAVLLLAFAVLMLSVGILMLARKEPAVAQASRPPPSAVKLAWRSHSGPRRSVCAVGLPYSSWLLPSFWWRKTMLPCYR
jgi:uncharacterized membrane protein YfcA